jgi:hypothetical protein
MNVKEWYEGQFVPWKNAVNKYLDLKTQNERRFTEHMGQLQTIITLLLDGRTKQAVLAWNSLQLQPALAEIELETARDELTLVLPAGKRVKLKLDDLIDDVQALLDAREVAGAAG